MDGTKSKTQVELSNPTPLFVSRLHLLGDSFYLNLYSFARQKTGRHGCLLQERPSPNCKEQACDDLVRQGSNDVLNKKHTQ